MKPPTGQAPEISERARRLCRMVESEPPFDDGQGCEQKGCGCCAAIQSALTAERTAALAEQAEAFKAIETAPQEQFVLVIEEQGIVTYAQQVRPNKWRSQLGETVWRPSHWLAVPELPR